ATVDDHFAVACAAAQVLVIDGFQAILPNHVAWLVTFVAIFRLFQLLRTNLADISEYMAQQSVFRIATLRSLLDAQGWILELMRIDPGHIRGSDAFLNQDRLKCR